MSLLAVILKVDGLAHRLHNKDNVRCLSEEFELLSPSVVLSLTQANNFQGLVGIVSLKNNIAGIFSFSIQEKKNIVFFFCFVLSGLICLTV